jgi:hypothetical protein
MSGGSPDSKINLYFGFHYGVIVYSTAQRTQEMAIRLALGSQRSSVMRLILISSAKLGLLGCGIGALAAVFAHPAARLAVVCRGSAGPTRHRAGSAGYFSAHTRGIGHSCVPCRLD